MSSDLVDEFARAEKLTRQAKILDQQMQAKSVAAGNLTEEQVSNILSHAQAHLLKLSNGENTGKNQSTKDTLFLAMLDYIEQLRQEIADMEKGFEDKYGDAWREELALKILDKDDIPERRADESIEEYRERLEIFLINELLNGDGSIKGEYKNNPEMREFAEWAQKNYHESIGDMIADDLKHHGGNSPQSRMLLGRLEEAKNSEVNLQAASKLGGHEQSKDKVLNVDDSISDRIGSQSQASFAQEFDKPIQS